MRGRTFTTFILTLGTVGLAVAAACAQSFSIHWFRIDGGGGTSSGGAFALSGMPGQPDASSQPMTNPHQRQHSRNDGASLPPSAPTVAVAYRTK